MTPTDELWNDMTQFDTKVADGIWDGMTPPADAPVWWSDVALLVQAAKGPAETAELAAEDDIVARMAAVLRDAATESTSDDAPDDGNDADHVTTAPARAGGSPDSLSDDTDSSDESDDAAPVPADPVVTPLRLVVVTVDTDDTHLTAEAADDEAEAAAHASDRDPSAADESAGATVVDLPVATAIDPEAAARETAAATWLRPAHAATSHRGRPRHQEPDEGPRHLKAPGPAANGLRLVRRALAVKAVATTTAVAIGITAAAAATGVVVTVVDPPKSETPETTITTSVAPPAAVGDDAEGSGSGGGDGGDSNDDGESTPTVTGRDGSMVTSPAAVLTCLLDFGPCDPDAVLDSATSSTVPGGSTTATTAAPSTTASTVGEPPPPVTETTVPAPDPTPTTAPPVTTTESTTSTTDTSLPQEPTGLATLDGLPEQARGRRNR